MWYANKNVVYDQVVHMDTGANTSTITQSTQLCKVIMDICIALCRDPSRHPSIIWTGKTHCGRAEICVDVWWTGNKIKEQKRSSKIIDIVSYAPTTDFKWCHMCVCRTF